MRTKTIILIAISAIAMLSFAFVVRGSEQTIKQEIKVDLSEAPAGGLEIDEK